MDYNSIAYKVEDGVIINSCLVSPQDMLDPEFIKRPYALGIGYEEKFGDYYPQEYTQEQYARDLDILTHKKQNYLDILEPQILEAQEQLVNLVETSETYQVDKEELDTRLEKLSKYKTYLNSFNIQNPLLQQVYAVEDSRWEE